MNWTLLSYKKEHIWVSSNEVDETRAYYAELSKSESETPITLHIYGIWKDRKDNPICKSAKETQI